MSKNQDPYGSAKSLLGLAIGSNIISVFLPVIGIPFLASFTILELMEEFDDFGPLPLMVLAISTILFIFVYTRLEDENAKYYIFGGAALNAFPVFIINQFRSELNTEVEFDIVNYQLGFFTLVISIIFGVIAGISMPKEEDLLQPSTQISSTPVVTSSAPVSTPPTYEESEAPAKPIGSSQPSQPVSPTPQSEGQFIYCGECGTRTTVGTKFCPECGSKL